nr:iron-sulfur cluster-binding domain-containing protein [Bradyrhizobium sp. BR 10289]
MSGLIHGRLSLKGIVDLQAPKGEFRLDEEHLARQEQLVLVAAGIGITPILAMLYDLRDRQWEGDLQLLYGVRSTKDEAFREEITELEGQLPRLKVTIFHSARGAPTGSRKIGRITPPDVVSAIKGKPLIYICGPAGMAEDLVSGLRQAGVDENRIRLEAFGPSSRPLESVNRGPQTIVLRKSKTSFAWQPEAGSLLDQIERHGVAAASGCRSGQCESCLVRLLDGAVIHPSTSTEIRKDQCLPCVAVPISSLVIDL